MSNLDISNGIVLSSSQATPQLTINHDVAADLDSSNAFEGPEKLLEVWFASSATSLPFGVQKEGLKAVSAGTWMGMLDLVNCKILSVIKSETVDAYLLSESSLFVFPHKIILKTCGTTTLLLGLHRLLRIAAESAGFPYHNASSLNDIHAAATPYRVFYSRKNFLFPEKQRGPHRSWNQEVKFLDDMFEGGSAYMVGKMNGDHWYLYITSPNTTLTPPRTPDAGGDSGNRRTQTTKIPAGMMSVFPDGKGDGNDETLEVLMTDLDPEKANQFYLSHASAVASERCPARAKEVRQASHEQLGHIGETTNGTGEDIFPVEMDDRNNIEDPPIAESLTTEGHALGTLVSNGCGLSDVYPTSIFPEARIDAYMFAPCGFSANGVVPAPTTSQHAQVGDDQTSTQSAASSSPSSGHYFTVHVTPEPNCSFASFETNVPSGQKGCETADTIAHVVGIFRPGRFSVTLFESKAARLSSDSGGNKRDSGSFGSKPNRLDGIGGYRRVECINYDFDDYNLVFRYYEREDWVGNGQARVGEQI